MLENFSTIKDYNQLYTKVDHYKVVSFDIFDTLVKRDVKKPTDVFKIVGKKIGMDSFATDRIEAEKQARRGKQEVTLVDIYEQLPPKYSKDRVREIEIATEIEISCPNEDLINFYNYCKRKKDVIIISDMYLDEPTVVNILKKCGITGYKKIYVSSEYGVTKLDKKLFLKALDDINVKPKDVVHIGNSFRADYIAALECGIKAIKIPTYHNRMISERTHLQNKKLRFSDYLDAFINNHTKEGECSKYYKFGFEKFGPVLYGYTMWLFDELNKKNMEQVLFFARDGYILKKVYEELGFDKYIPCYYFEASRRSIRVPFYTNNMSYQEMVDSLTVPSLTNITQILDSWGLNVDSYLDALDEYNISINDVFFKSDLLKNEKMMLFYQSIQDDIYNNSKKELNSLNQYLQKFDFSKKTAIVDIGWGGSMQKYIEIILKRKKVPFDIVGFYMGLTAKSKDNLKKGTAYGYLFDSLNHNDCDLERPFVGLFETLFLEQDGSVKNYFVKDGNVIVNRYPYEYSGSKEAEHVSDIQDGAIDFIKLFKDNILSLYIDLPSNVMFSYLQTTGLFPNKIDIQMFGNFDFFNNGTKVKLAHPKKLWHYFVHIKSLKKDLYDSQWKIGFLKSLFKLDINYYNIYKFIICYIKK